MTASDTAAAGDRVARAFEGLSVALRRIVANLSGRSPVEHDSAHDEDDERVGPLCAGFYRPGTWHHPRRRPLPDLEVARAAARGARRMERST